MKYLLLIISIFCLIPISSSALKVEAFLHMDYGNQKNEISVRQSGERPATFVPSGFSTFGFQDRKIYVCDGLKFAIKEFDFVGSLLREIPFDQEIRAEGAILFGDIHLTTEEIYLTDTQRGWLYVMDYKGKLLRKISTKSIDKSFTSPCLIFRDKKNRLYVQDRNTDRLFVSEDENFKNFTLLHRVCNPMVLDNGNIVTTHLESDNRQATISLIDREGRFLCHIHRIKEETAMNQVQCLGMNEAKVFYFTYRTRGKIHFLVLSPTGRIIDQTTFITGLNILLLAREGILTPDGVIYRIIAEQKSVRIDKFFP
jgi:hypothetical protein